MSVIINTMNKDITQKSKSRTNKIGARVKSLPKTPGVYLYRDKAGKVIYVGKAVNLKNRVSSYFNNQPKDPKTEELVKNIFKLDTIEVGSEFEALILESDLVKRYKPKYNIRLKDDKSYVYLKITKEDYPRISVIRQITDTEAKYLGPFIDPLAVRNILKIARRIFPYCSCSKTGDDVCLYYHIGLCPGHSSKYISKVDYAKNIRGIEKLFAGKTDSLKKEFKKEMRLAAKDQKYELAASYRDKLHQLDRIERSHFISERDLAADVALVQLKKELNLSKMLARIECYDISNIMGTAAVGSMVTFVNGVASPKDYRRFQIRTVKGSNDFAMLSEVLKRRFSDANAKKWKAPDLVILDGGKGQLSAVLKSVIIPDGVRVVALAKRLEEIVTLSDSKFEIRKLKAGSEAFFLVQRIRDEAHRFAITYHRKLKSREMYETSLDTIPGIGPKTKKKLLKEFGSIKKIKEADIIELEKVVGDKLSKVIKEKL